MRAKTIAIQHGYDNTTDQKTMAVPIYQTTAYQFDNTQHGADLFDLKVLGNIYTRLTNPTVAIYEQRVAALEKGAGALAVASGSSAIFYAIINIAKAGDNIVAANQLYGGTINQFLHILSSFNIEVRFFDMHNIEQAEALIDSKTKALFFETLNNPGIKVPEIDRLAQLADKHNILSIVDNTVATPVICRPLEHGIDVVVHSASKYLCGQGNALGGVIVERENIVEKIKDNPRFESFHTPDPSYHGLVIVDVPLPIFTLRIRISHLRDIGAALSPFNAWLLIQSLETLHIRMKEHSHNAMKVAEFLQAHAKVKKVHYPGLATDNSHTNASKFFEKSLFSGLLSFDVDDFALAEKIANKTKLFTLAVNIGDTKSIITHPASTTHRQLSPEALAKADVRPGLVRLSVGIEDVEDLIEDLQQALS